MPNRPNKTQMPRAAALPTDPERSEAVVWGVAFGISVLFAVGQFLTILAAAPAAMAYYRSEPTAPWFVELVRDIGPIALALAVIALDVALLAIPFWLARKYWIGFAFLPPILYLGSGAVMLWLLLADALRVALFAG